jgi:hypothetical protein
VALLTASGLKDPEVTASMQDELLTVSGDVDDVFAQLKTKILV